tara:strand:- start:287 stop:1444 length:1158 start_codon:yes stop_codon:yes gene_type:complete
MGLSVFQSLAIAGGKAAETISKVERERKLGIKNALFKSIEDAVAPANEYRQKHLLVKNKAKEEIEKIVSTYFTDESLGEIKLSRPAKVAAAQALYSKFGYDSSKIQASYQDKIKAANMLGSTQYNTLNFLNDQFQDLAKVSNNQNINEISTLIAQNKVGSPPTGFDTSLSLINEMDSGSSIVTSPINTKTIGEKAKSALGLPNVAEGELPTISMKPEYNHSDVLKETQKYNLDSTTIAKNNEALKNVDKWKPSDWKGFYNDQAKAVINASTLKITLIPNGTGGFDFRMPGGDKQVALKREVERNTMRNFVIGAASSGRLDDKNFLQYVQANSSSIVGLSMPDKGEQLIPGMTYVNTKGARIIYTGTEVDGKPRIIELISNTPVNR